ncbi:PH domain-containing protein [Hymenobacter tibetensis]|uniref:PH domain-containing protein n=1 Tax=Hymenobacter tibetensis TaxID=497967 RepID=A0ABY4CT37_9BACT|nr:PH domain-containing protein [Hymenobacter tibetensis]UOG73207.1 PH domain-containing protein [Hymenobacter tibetensis]
MLKIFKSAVSWWLVGPIFLFLMGVPLISWQHPAAFLTSAAMCWLTSAYVFYMMRTTLYTLTPTHLVVQCGLWRMQVALDSITKVMPTRNPLSSPAFSLDRLEISYGKYDTVLVSPVNKLNFLQALHQLNPTIQLPL